MARPFTVIGFTMFFTLALVFELGQKAAVVILSAAAAAFIFSLFFKSVRRDFVIPTACIAAVIAVLLSFAAALVPDEASQRFNDGVHTVKASVVSLEEQSGERYYTELKTSEIDGEKYYIYDSHTDSSGILDNLQLPAPDKSLSETEQGSCGLAPYATYDIFVSHPGFISTYLENVPIFDSTVSIQSVEMLPTISGEQNPNVINESV